MFGFLVRLKKKQEKLKKLKNKKKEKGRELPWERKVRLGLNCNFSISSDFKKSDFEIDELKFE